MEKAPPTVENGMSLHEASEIYELPNSTLHDRVTGKVIFGAKSYPSSYLTSVTTSSK